jgi:hypothetical protein
VLANLVKEELRRGAHQEAAGWWRTLSNQLPKYRIDVPTLLQLAPTIGKIEGQKGALELLEQCVDAGAEGLTGPMAHRVAQWSVELDPNIARIAAERALKKSDLAPAARDELKMLLTALSPGELKTEPESKEPAPSVFFEESDRSAFGESSDLSVMMAETFPDGVLTHATPVSLGPTSITLRFKGAEEEQQVDHHRIRGISAVGVRGLSDKPVVILDLLIDGGGGPLPLSVLRLRGDEFDPRDLVPNSESMRAALHEMVTAMQSSTGAQLLADITSTPPRPKIVFEGIDDYHDQILRPAAEMLG